MIAFLADENISPESADYLEALGYPCYSLRREGPWRLSDSEIVDIARREGRIILTTTWISEKFTIPQQRAKWGSSFSG